MHTNRTQPTQASSGRYAALFSRLHVQQEAAFVPFVTLGDPHRAQSLAIIDTLIEAGADALELGIPFSDPSADGPTIQAATLRALHAGVTPSVCFEMLFEIRKKHPAIPIGLLMYANLVYANGIAHFYAQCAQAGVDSVLIADVPVEESGEFRAVAEQYGIDTIFICPPNADELTLHAVSQHSKGYTYLLSRAGVTGTESRAQMPLDHLVRQLRDYNAPPALLGFGIAEPSQVTAAIQAGAAGAISGSAVVNIIAKHLDQPQQMLTALSDFIRPMKAATRNLR